MFPDKGFFLENFIFIRPVNKWKLTFINRGCPVQKEFYKLDFYFLIFILIMKSD